MRRGRTSRRVAPGRPRYFAIGILVIVALVVFSYVSFKRGLPFVHNFRVQAVVANASHLRPGSPVRIAGIDVGAVKKVTGGPGPNSTIYMQIKDNGLPLHRDATLRIRPRVFLEGGFYVDLRAGTPSAPELAENGTIPRPQTSVPVQFSQLLSVFDRPVRRSTRSVIGEFSLALDRRSATSLRGLAPVLTPTLQEVRLLAAALQGTSPGDLATVLRSTSAVTGTLAQRENQLADLVTNLRKTTGAVASEDRALADGLTQVAGLMREAPGALTDVDRSLPNLQRFSRVLDPGLKVAVTQLPRVTRAVRDFGKVVAFPERRRVLIALNTALVDIPTLLRRLGVLFTTIKPTTDCLSRNILPILYEKVPDGSLSSNRPVWQDFVHGLVGLAAAAQNFTGNGYSLRYQAGTGPQSVGLNFGNVPVLGPLLGAVDPSNPIQGSRPVWLGSSRRPEVRPDVPCTTQAVPSLAARTGPPGASSTGRRLGPTPPLSAHDVRALRRLLAKARATR